MLKAWIFNGTTMFVLGLVVGWILLKRPEWVSTVWQWIKHRIFRFG